MQVKVTGLSTVSTSRLQEIVNKLHTKYESMQRQILAVDDLNEYDWLYTGATPFKIIRYDDEDKIDMQREYANELNHRHLILNDYNITEKDVLSGNYGTIYPLYRFVFHRNDLIFNVQHALCDGLSVKEILHDFLRLLNGESFDESIVQHLPIEECVDPKYASSPLLNKATNYVPSWFKFIKHYSNNALMSKYNPLSAVIHNDDILRFKHMFFDENKNMIAFPLKLPYNKYDWKLNHVTRSIDRKTTKNVLKQCKLNKGKMSALLTYLTNAAVISLHSDVLKKDFYKTVIGNTFSTWSMYRDPNKTYIGMHSSAYNKVIPYYKKIKLNGKKFWKIIEKIGHLELTEDRVVKLYRNKFPVFNFKRFLKYTWDDMLGKRSMGPPTISNPGRFVWNKASFKHKAVKVNCGSNPAIGFGAPYFVGSCSIKGIDELSISFLYGTQYFSEETAEQIMQKLIGDLKEIAASPIVLKAKL